MVITEILQRLQSLNGKMVQVDLISATTVSYIFKNFEYVDFENYIAFGENGCEVFTFDNLQKDMISEDLNDNFVNDEYNFSFKLDNYVNGLTSYIAVLNLDLDFFNK